MEKRMAFLETRLSNCLDNLSTVSLQLTALQDFLRKQFGHCFMDYILKRGVPSNSSSSSGRIVRVKKRKTNVSTQKPHQPLQQQPILPQHQSNPILISKESGYLNDNKMDEDDLDNESDPSAFVEIVDDANYKEEDIDKKDFKLDVKGKHGNFDASDESEEDSSGIVIVNYRTDSTNGETSSTPQTLRLQSRPQPRIKPVDRKHTSVPTSGLGPMAKRPGLQPKPQIRAAQSEASIDEFPISPIQTAGGNSSSTQNSSASLYDDLSLAVREEGQEGVGQDYDESLKAFYDILPDNSVQCRICQQIFKNRWPKFERHYKTHTGERPYECHHCGERFARKDTMYSHVRTQHEQLKGERPFKCRYCGKKYTRKNNMQSHLRMKHEQHLQEHSYSSSR